MQSSVTLIIPTLNRPSFLQLALDSALSQDYSNLEILVSDNGSTAETSEVIKDYISRDPRLKTRRNNSTVEMTTHLNQCFLAANGKYIIVLSDDDIVSPHFISGLVKSFEQNPDIAVALPHCFSIDEHGNRTNDFMLPTWETKAGHQFVTDWLWSKESAYAATFFTFFARKEDLLNAGGHPDFEKGLHTDNALFISICLKGSVTFSKDSVFNYRIYSSSTGLSQGFQALAKASAQFFDYAYHNPVFLKALSALTYDQINLIQRGIARVSAQTYMNRLQNLLQQPDADPTEAINAYQPDIEYINCLNEFVKNQD